MNWSDQMGISTKYKQSREEIKYKIFPYFQQNNNLTHNFSSICLSTIHEQFGCHSNIFYSFSIAFAIAFGDKNGRWKPIAVTRKATTLTWDRKGTIFDSKILSMA